jgi:hypothetical protein
LYEIGNFLITEKEHWKAQSKKEKEGKTLTGLSPRHRKAYHSISTALLQSIAKIRTQSTMNE